MVYSVGIFNEDMSRNNQYNKLDFENLTCLGRLIYPWTIRIRNELAIRHIPKDTQKLLDFGGAHGYLIRNTFSPKAVSIDEKIILYIDRDEDGRIIREESGDGFLFVDKLPFQDICFDCITAIAIVEHIKNLRSLMKEFHRILRDEGTLIITTPNHLVDKILPFLDKGSNQLRGKKVTEEHEHYLDRSQMQWFAEDLFTLKIYRKFQFGLNQLFVFEKMIRHRLNYI
ncbi:MAG: hypothetical protein C0403_13540 [Desulfobacterium sp.]|nr:hypothetical protein [Desulfobacterium sp.]